MDARGFVANKVADARLSHDERREWYRQLRLLKQRRRKLARTLDWLSIESWHVGNRLRALREQYEALGLVTQWEDAVIAAGQATSRAEDAADEADAFARERVMFGPGVGVVR